MIIRPHKFLRKWINFELRFGEDMILDKTKSQIRREFKKKWNNIDEKEIKEFLKKKLNTHIIFSSDLLEKCKKKYYKDPNFYSEFNNWKREKVELEKLEQDYYSHIDRMESDFSKNPYVDKLKEKVGVNKKTYVYTFEDGTKSTFIVDQDTKGEYSTKSKVSASFIENGKSRGMSFSGYVIVSKLVKLINFINQHSIKRTRQQETYSNKRRRYDLLKKTLNGYKEQLQKEKSNGVDHTHTLNEISSLKNRISEMEEKYGYY